MREKCGFLVFAWALLSFFVLFASMPASAADMQTNGVGQASPGTVPGAQPINTPGCPGAANGTNSLDNAARTNLTAVTEALFTAAHNIGTAFPIIPAGNACMQNLLAAMSGLPGLADPLGVVTTAIGGLLTGILGQVCSQVMGEITSIQNSLLNLTKVCLPMPKFGGIDLPKWNQQSCSGGLQLNFLTAFGAPSVPAAYNYRTNLQ